MEQTAEYSFCIFVHDAIHCYIYTKFWKWCLQKSIKKLYSVIIIGFSFIWLISVNSLLLFSIAVKQKCIHLLFKNEKWT